MKSIKIVGIGSGSIQELTLKAYKTIEDASIVIAFDRVAQLLSEINKNIINVKLSNLVDEIEKLKDEEIVIVLSGDINFYSATNYIQRN
ncbi:MAG: SAM-dependent methyltransferase, partial [Erysipelotrichales bacterium]